MSKKRKKTRVSHAHLDLSGIRSSIRPLHTVPPVFPSSFCMQHEGDCPEVYAQGPKSIGNVVYRKKAARPAAAAKPGIAVCIAPAAFDELDDEEAPADAAELALDPTLLDFDEAELATLEVLAPAPPLKMVVEPTVVEKVEEPEVSTETMAEVVTAEEDPPAPVEDEPDEPDEPDPPAPPAP